MALVTVPSAAWQSTIAWSLSQPDQIVVESPGGVNVFNRSTGRWIGDWVIPAMATGQEAQEVAAFLDELQGALNEFEVPMRQDAVIAGSPRATVSSTSIVGGRLQISVNGTRSFKRGNMVRIGGRAYRVTADQTGAAIRVLPNNRCIWRSDSGMAGELQ